MKSTEHSRPAIFSATSLSSAPDIPLSFGTGLLAHSNVIVKVFCRVGAKRRIVREVLKTRMAV